MLELNPIFMRHAAPPELAGQEAAAASGADSGAESSAGGQEGGILTLEYTDSPFESFLRRLERLLATNPREALYLGRIAHLDGVFEGPDGLRLAACLEEITAAVQLQEGLSPAFAVQAAALPVPELAPDAVSGFTAPEVFMSLSPALQSLRPGPSFP